MSLNEIKYKEAKDNAMMYTFSYDLLELKEQFHKTKSLNENVDNHIDFFLGIAVGFVLNKFYQGLVLQDINITSIEKDFINNQVMQHLSELKDQVRTIIQT